MTLPSLQNAAKVLILIGALNWGYVGVRRIFDKDDEDKTHNPRDLFALLAANDEGSAYDTNTAVCWIQIIVYLLVAFSSMALIAQKKK